MCDFCVAMTAGEAAAFYDNVKAGKVTEQPGHFGGSQAPRADLPTRQKEELELGAFEDQPAFRKALQELCADWTNGSFSTGESRNLDGAVPQFTFERALVDLRAAHDQPVLSSAEVRVLINQARVRSGIAAHDHDAALHGHDHVHA